MEQKREPINKLTPRWSIYDKGSKNIQWEKESLFNKWHWENWTATCKRMKLDHYLTLWINSKWIKDLNVKPETIKLLEESTDSKVLDTGLGNDFLNLTQSKSNRSKNKQVGLHQTKKFLHGKGIVNKIKKQPTKLEKIFANHISENGLISKVCKNSYNSIAKNKTKQKFDSKRGRRPE